MWCSFGHFYHLSVIDNKVKTVRRGKGNAVQALSRALALVAGLLLLVIVELGLRALGIGPSNDLFMAEGGDYRLNPQAARRFFPHQYARLAPGQDRFAQDKDEGVLRIFVLGASTLLGFPNPAQTSFPNFLQLMLEDAYPGREIEVINCGITAINSYVLLDFAEEVAAQEPDLVLIYAGHNEFVGPYGAATPFVRLGSDRSFIKLQMRLQRTRIYYLLGEALYYAGQWLRPDGQAPSFGLHLVQREIYWGDAAHAETTANYRDNLSELLAIMRTRGVPVALCTLVSNLEGFYPLRSQEPAPPAGAELAEIVNDYPHHAGVHFATGLDRKARADAKGALEAFKRARDLDAIHLRACAPFNNILRESAVDGVWLIDLERAFAAAAPEGIVGDELISEYLHPTVWGHYLMARNILAQIVQREEAFAGEGVDPDVLKSFAQYCRRLGYGVQQRVLARNDLILLLRNMPYRDRPQVLEERLSGLVAEQLSELPKMSYAQIEDFAGRGGFVFLAKVIEEAGDGNRQRLAAQLMTLAQPLGFMP